MEKANYSDPKNDSIRLSGIDLRWDLKQGTCTFDNMPVAMMWVDSTLAGLMSGVQAMVGTERFILALQSEGRKSIEADWQSISRFPDFRDGFKAIANIAGVAGWGEWTLLSLDEKKKECLFRVIHSWESRYQKSLGVSWGSGMLAGKLAGYCSKLFGTNCWADQTAFITKGDAYDEFVVKPSSRSVENEIENLLLTDEATRADVIVALRKLEQEVAERIRTQEELEASHSMLQGVLDAVPDLLMVIDKDFQIQYSNDKGHEHIITDDPEKQRTCFGRYKQLGAPCDDCSAKPALESGEVVEREMVNPVDGRIKEIRTFPIHDSAGRIIRAVEYVRDITDRKRVEDERRDLERRLLHTQKLESLGILAGGIAHDFNNLLMAILGNLELALVTLPPGSGVHSSIEQAINATHRASNLTQQMLAYSGKRRFIILPLELNDLIRENDALFQSAIARTATTHLNLTHEQTLIEADAGQVQQIILNLITNASEAIGDKPGVITVTTGIGEFDNRYLSQSLLAEKPSAGEFVYVEMADTGCGMDEETIARLFDPFFTTKFTGRGLGMSAVSGIVQGHKGAILVTSAINGGTSIRVLFPKYEKEAIITDHAPPCNAPGKTSGKILVVDDESSVRIYCLDALEYLGYEGIGAADGEEALQIFKKNRAEIACVLLDLTMPNMDGTRTFQKMKQLNPNVKVILTSGYDERESIQRFLGQGLAGFIHKPYSMDELKKKISNVLNS